MKYIDESTLAKIAASEFQGAEPFPWVNFQGFLTPEGYDILRKNDPDLGLFTKDENVQRKYGQKPHDRYQLKYVPGLPVPAVWHEFVAELESPVYRDFIARLFGTKAFTFDMRWLFSSKSNSISPHCDGARKLGTHLIYLNSSEDWDDSWGGQTLILDDGGAFKEESAPAFEDFKRIIPAKALDNYSLIFKKTPHSWHGVRDLECPEGNMRRIFSVTLDLVPSWSDKIGVSLRSLLKGGVS